MSSTLGAALQSAKRTLSSGWLYRSVSNGIRIGLDVHHWRLGERSRFLLRGIDKAILVRVRARTCGAKSREIVLLPMCFGGSRRQQANLVQRLELEILGGAVKIREVFVEMEDCLPIHLNGRTDQLGIEILVGSFVP